MVPRSLRNRALFSLTTVMLVLPPCFSQTKRPAAQTARVKSNPETQEKVDANRLVLESQEMMRQGIADLSQQIGSLIDELRKLRRESERSTGILELLLSEERLAKVEDQVREALDRKAQLDARELEIQRRMKNIQAELLFRAAVRRDEAEAAIRAELQRSLDGVHNQQSISLQRVAELQAQAERLKQRVERLRKKFDQEDTKGESQSQ